MKTELKLFITLLSLVWDVWQSKIVSLTPCAHPSLPVDCDVCHNIMCVCSRQYARRSWSCWARTRSTITSGRWRSWARTASTGCWPPSRRQRHRRASLTLIIQVRAPEHLQGAHASNSRRRIQFPRSYFKGLWNLILHLLVRVTCQGLVISFKVEFGLEKSRFQNH